MAEQQAHTSRHSQEAPATVLAQLAITGGTATDNLIDAEALGKFMAHIAEATKALSHAIAEDRYEESRDSHGRATKRKVKTQPLQVESPEYKQSGTPTLTFRAPAPLRQGQLGTGIEEYLPLEDLAENTIESQALRAIFTTFTRASAADTPDPEGLLEPLETPSVREVIRRAVSIVRNNGWTITGEIRQRNQITEPLLFNSRVQARLADALKADLVGKYRASLRGTIDGHKNSNNTIYFRPANFTQSWSTVAATDVLFTEAARISLDVQNSVTLTVEFEPKVDRQGNPTERLVRRIVSIDTVHPGKGQTLF